MDISEFYKCSNDLDYLASKYFTSSKLCMSHDKVSCKGDIINAHTISKKFLKNISDNNSIYYPTPSSKRSNLYNFELKNINKVTCFTGFCRYHDEILFQSFEKFNFSYSYKQIFDISFRSLCREYYLKKSLLKFYKKFVRGELKIMNNTGYFQSKEFKIKHKHLLKEINDHKFIYNKLSKASSTGLNYIVVQIDKLPIMATGVFFPLYYPNGEIFQDNNKEQHGFIYSVFSSKEESYIIISTIQGFKKNIHNKYLKSLLELENK